MGLNCAVNQGVATDHVDLLQPVCPANRARHAAAAIECQRPGIRGIGKDGTSKRLTCAEIDKTITDKGGACGREGVAIEIEVPVPLTLNPVAKTAPLKFTVVALAPALMLRNLAKSDPVNPVTVELPTNTMLAVLLPSVVIAPSGSLLVLIFWLLPTVKVPGVTV